MGPWLRSYVSVVMKLHSTQPISVFLYTNMLLLDSTDRSKFVDQRRTSAPVSAAPVPDSAAFRQCIQAMTIYQRQKLPIWDLFQRFWDRRAPRT
jgi:hypothetical protein